jgi:hypothetical protein
MIFFLLIFAPGFAHTQSSYKNSAKVVSSGGAWTSNAVYQHFGVIAEPVVSGYVSNNNIHGTLGFLYNDDIKSLTPPLPAALIYPPDNSVLSRSPDNPLTISFYSTEQDDVIFKLQVASDADFSTIYIDTNIKVNHFTAKIGNDNVFYWQIQATRGGLSADWSPVWKFSIITTGIDNEPETKIYPNPVLTTVQIIVPPEFTDGNIEILDLFGRKRIAIHNISTLSVINTDKLEAGMYFITVNKEELRITAKIIKQ